MGDVERRRMPAELVFIEQRLSDGAKATGAVGAGWVDWEPGEAGEAPRPYAGRERTGSVLRVGGLMKRRRIGWGGLGLRAGVAVAVAAVGLIPVAGFASPPASSSSWRIQHTVDPLTPNGTIDAVSCGAANACMAVGYYVTPVGKHATLAETWDGTAWRVPRTPNPGAAVTSILSAVSCPAAYACTAVGYSATSSGIPRTLAEVWNGISWSIVATPNPTGTSGSNLSGVSCPAADACMAVGSFYFNSSGVATLAEAWNGSSWKIRATTNRGNSVLLAVSCPAAIACTAVGHSINNLFANVPLAEAWDGTSWTTLTTPTPIGARASSLLGVSCTAVRACSAVGYYDGSAANQLSLAEAWDGTSWTIQATPNPSARSGLTAVSCTAPNACKAVGSYRKPSGRALTLVEAWDGSSWTTQTTPSPTRNSSLSGVACTAADACTSVGGSYDAGKYLGFAEPWNGATWGIHIMPLPLGALDLNSLAAVSCPAPNMCMAVGDTLPPVGDVAAVTKRWDGTSWRNLRPPSPGGSTNIDLSGVSCSSANVCTVVGNYLGPSGYVPLAEAWDGTSWHIQTMPNPSGATGYLRGVSCRAASACTAVGVAAGSTGDKPLAEAWDGTSWQIQATPAPPGVVTSDLLGVSCTPAGACTAVGWGSSTSNQQNPFAEAWDGNAWTVETTPSPAGAQQSRLLGVSCPAANACTAVGNASPALRSESTLIEAWDGTSWRIESSPNPTPVSALSGVSCPAANACTAVGSATDSSGIPMTLAEAWDGNSWTVQPTRDPTGSTSSSLSAVSCVAAGACTAVGSYFRFPIVSLTLAEAERAQ